MKQLSEEMLSKFRATMQGVQVIVVDEASMLGTKYLERLHARLVAARSPDDPRRSAFFAGYRVIFVGDFAQCPPI